MNPTRANKRMSSIFIVEASKEQSVFKVQGELDPSWISNLNWFCESGRCICARSIHRIDQVDILFVEQVEGFGHNVQMTAPDGNHLEYPQIEVHVGRRLQTVAWQSEWAR